MQKMEIYLRECEDINYTVVKPPGLTNGRSKGNGTQDTENCTMRWSPTSKDMAPIREIERMEGINWLILKLSHFLSRL